MSDIILTLDELEELFYDLTVSILGGSPEADVRRSWPTGGAPAFDILDNVVFFKVYDTAGPLTAQRENKYSQLGSPVTPNMATRYTRTLMVNWIFYGSAAWDHATLIRNGLFYQDHHDTLARQDIYMVPDFTPPRRVPELFQGLWYERMDLSVSFNELIEINRTVPALESAEIIINDYSGVKAVIDITE